jgi:transposase
MAPPGSPHRPLSPRGNTSKVLVPNRIRNENSDEAWDGSLNSEDVVAFLEHLLREIPGRLVVIWDGAPMHRSQVIKDFLASGAAQRMHLERLPAYAPELNPGEGLWQQLKGVELRNLCCVNIPHLRGELRDAVKQVRRKPHLIKSFFRGANL